MLKFIIVICLTIAFYSNHAIAYDIRSIEPHEISKEIYESKKVKLVFIFTSWCSACKRSLSEVIDIADDFKDKPFKLILLSLDDDENKLIKILQPFHDKPVKVLRVKQDDPKDVINCLSKAKIQYTGKIPHEVVINGDEVVINGSYRLDDIRQAIKSMLS